MEEEKYKYSKAEELAISLGAEIRSTPIKDFPNHDDYRYSSVLNLLMELDKFIGGFHYQRLLEEKQKVKAG